MRLEMSGRFQQIVKFAYELGKVDRIINVENIELADPKVVGDEIILRGRCLATAFHALAPKEAPRGGQGMRRGERAKHADPPSLGRAGRDLSWSPAVPLAFACGSRRPRPARLLRLRCALLGPSASGQRV